LGVAPFLPFALPLPPLVVVVVRLVLPLDDPAAFVLRLIIDVQHFARLAVDDLVIRPVLFQLPLPRRVGLVLCRHRLGLGVVRIVLDRQHLAGRDLDDLHVLRLLLRPRGHRQTENQRADERKLPSRHIEPPFE